MCKNTGYLVTFSKPSNISPFDKRVPLGREKKGNKVTSILHNIFLFLLQKYGDNAGSLLVGVTEPRTLGLDLAHSCPSPCYQGLMPAIKRKQKEVRKKNIINQ